MTSSKIVLGAASGAAGGAGLDVDEVFSTHLWTGNSSTQTINNGLDLSTEGGLVWIKKRSGNSSHFLFGSDRDANNKALLTNTELGYYGTSYSVTHSSTGFGISSTSSGDINENGQDYVSWSFRVAEKFFDVVKYTGNATARTISHNLGSVPGMIIIKQTNTTRNWIVYHHSLGTTKHLSLNQTLAAGNDNSGEYWGGTTPTSTQFSLGDYFAVNQNGGTYVAYLFAHNNSGDGGFGPDGDQDIIKCGSFTSDGSGGATVNLGFEPQWLMYKPSSTTGPWVIVDSMRGWTANAESRTLTAESIGAEQSQVNLSSSYPLNLRSNGFDTSNALYASQTYIYMAIRRGSLFPPTDATKVFGSLAYTGNGASDREYTVGSAVSDMLFQACRSSSSYNYPHLSSRLTGKGLTTASTGSEVTLAYQFDKMDGVHETGFENTLNQSSQTFIMHSWKRAPSYFDVCAYSGSGTATQPHSLSASPEIIWIKQRDGTANWTVLTNFTSTQYDYLYLNQTSAATTVNYSANEYLSAAPTATGIPFVDYYGVNDSNPQQKYIAYLFASVAGLSKISSVVHSGTTNVDAGFSNGSRFVLLKRTDATGDWLIWDGTRGIVSGNDPYLLLNSAAAEVTNTDYIDPLSSGFTLTSNLTSGTYIYYAIA